MCAGNTHTLATTIPRRDLITPVVIHYIADLITVNHHELAFISIQKELQKKVSDYGNKLVRYKNYLIHIQRNRKIYLMVKLRTNIQEGDSELLKFYASDYFAGFYNRLGGNEIITICCFNTKHSDTTNNTKQYFKLVTHHLVFATENITLHCHTYKANNSFLNQYTVSLVETQPFLTFESFKYVLKYMEQRVLPNTDTILIEVAL